VVSTSGVLGLLAFGLMLRAMIRSLRAKITVPGHEWLEAIRSATLISIYSIVLRGLLDAKPHDWSFYVLCSIAVSYGMMRAAIERGAQEQPTEAPQGGPSRFPAAAARYARPGFTR
jgi:hypothetical protein